MPSAERTRSPPLPPRPRLCSRCRAHAAEPYRLGIWREPRMRRKLGGRIPWRKFETSGSRPISIRGRPLSRSGSSTTPEGFMKSTKSEEEMVSERRWIPWISRERKASPFNLLLPTALGTTIRSLSLCYLSIYLFPLFRYCWGDLFGYLGIKLHVIGHGKRAKQL